MTHDQIKSFVRHTLGCRCRDEVFEKVYCEEDVHITPQLLLRSRINIGDKLLIYIADAPDIEFVRLNLPTLLSSGTRQRDSKEFNRFRLVLLSPQAPIVSKIATSMFCALKTDEKVHLHVISAKDFPTHKG